MKLLPIKVHFNEMSMATIVSLATILDLKGYYATMDSREELAILVYASDGKMLKFLQCRVYWRVYVNGIRHVLCEVV